MLMHSLKVSLACMACVLQAGQVFFSQSYNKNNLKADIFWSHIICVTLEDNISMNPDMYSG